MAKPHKTPIQKPWRDLAAAAARDSAAGAVRRKRRKKLKELSGPDLIRATQFRDDALGTDLMRNNALLRHLSRQESVDHIPIGYNPGWTEL